MSEAGRNDSKSQSAKSFSPEDITKFVVALGTLFYVIGVLTVNSYLQQLGVTDFSLVSAQFIYTGATVAGLAVLGCIFPLLWYWGTRGDIFNAVSFFLFGSSASKRVGKYSHRDLIISMAWGIIASILYYLLIVMAAEQSRQLQNTRPKTQSIFLEALQIYLFGTLIIVLLTFLLRSRNQLKLFSMTVLIIAILALCYYYISLFATTIYPVAPKQLGGGRPEVVKLLVAEDQVVGVQQLGIPVSNRQLVSEPVVLLFEGSTTYAVRSPTGAVVQLNKDLVRGIQVRNPTR